MTAATTSAQDPYIDSLNAVLGGKLSNRQRIETLIEKCIAYSFPNLDSSLAAGQTAARFADSLEMKDLQAEALRRMGNAYAEHGQGREAMDLLNQALKLYTEINDKAGMSSALNSLGTVYNDEKDDAKALDHYIRSLKLAEEAKDDFRIMSVLVNMGTFYYDKSKENTIALNHFNRALDLSEKIKDDFSRMVILINMAEIYQRTQKLDSSAYRLDEAVKLSNGDESFYSEIYQGYGSMYLAKNDIPSALRSYRVSLDVASRQQSPRNISKARIGMGNAYLAMNEFDNAITNFSIAVENARESHSPGDLEDAYKGLTESFKKKGNYEDALYYQQLLGRTKDSIYTEDLNKQMAGLTYGFEIEKKENQIQLQNANIQRQKLAKNSALAGLGLILLIAMLIYRGYRTKVKTNKILDKQKGQIEDLLHNILPEEVAKELQEEGEAHPRYFDSVSVLFTDFKGFTKLADTLSPQEVVEELSACFVGFDQITERYGLEKIKTIGDSYMCAGGLPVPNKTHAFDIVMAAREMQEFIINRNREREAKGLPPWEIRVGIHSGPVVAGVVGKKKYAYDIWGSTVNIASRMESNGEPGQINVSSTTYEIIKDRFPCTYRGKIYAKNVGDIDMYFVDAPVLRLAQQDDKAQSVSAKG